MQKKKVLIIPVKVTLTANIVTILYIVIKGSVFIAIRTRHKPRCQGGIKSQRNVSSTLLN